MIAALYHRYMELIASDNSALDVLSIQHVSTHAYGIYHCRRATSHVFSIFSSLASQWSPPTVDSPSSLVASLPILGTPGMGENGVFHGRVGEGLDHEGPGIDQLHLDSVDIEGGSVK